MAPAMVISSLLPFNGVPILFIRKAVPATLSDPDADSPFTLKLELGKSTASDNLLPSKLKSSTGGLGFGAFSRVLELDCDIALLALHTLTPRCLVPESESDRRLQLGS